MPRKAAPPRLVEHPKTGIYRVRYWDADAARARFESMRTTDPGEAKARFADWLAAGRQAKQGAVTIGDILNDYLEEHVEFHVAAPAQERHYCRLLREAFGHLLPEQIAPGDINRYVVGRGISPGTARRELGALIAALNHAFRSQRIRAVPYIPRPAPPQAKDRWLTTDEIARLLEASKSKRVNGRLARVERFIWIAIEAPARKRAIETLRWDKVDLSALTIDFREADRAQTKKRRTVVPISGRLLPILQRAYRERENGRVLDMSGSIRKAFSNVVAEAGLEDVTPHTLRHTAATHMARAGVPLWQIAGVLGNSAQTVAKVYAHHSTDALRGAVNYQR